MDTHSDHPCRTIPTAVSDLARDGGQWGGVGYEASMSIKWDHERVPVPAHTHHAPAQAVTSSGGKPQRAHMSPRRELYGRFAGLAAAAENFHTGNVSCVPDSDQPLNLSPIPDSCHQRAVVSPTQLTAVSPDRLPRSVAEYAGNSPTTTATTTAAVVTTQGVTPASAPAQTLTHTRHPEITSQLQRPPQVNPIAIRPHPGGPSTIAFEVLGLSPGAPGLSPGGAALSPGATALSTENLAPGPGTPTSSCSDASAEVDMETGEAQPPPVKKKSNRGRKPGQCKYI